MLDLQLQRNSWAAACGSVGQATASTSPQIWGIGTRRKVTSEPELGVMTSPAATPLRLSSFIGRKKEMGELRRLLVHTRLLTVLGPGGAGKTRLAAEFARAQSHRFADGQITVELVEVRDPALVPDAFARAAGIRLQAEDTIGTLVHRL